jgi:hypothetical protein
MKNITQLIRLKIYFLKLSVRVLQIFELLEAYMVINFIILKD